MPDGLLRVFESPGQCLQAVKQDAGEELGSVLEGYLNILQGFLNDGETDASAKPKPKAQSKSAPARNKQVELKNDD